MNMLPALLGVLYLIGILAAVAVALASNDTRRRSDACKVLRMLLFPLPQPDRQRKNNHTETPSKEQ